LLATSSRPEIRDAGVKIEKLNEEKDGPRNSEEVLAGWEHFKGAAFFISPFFGFRSDLITYLKQFSFPYFIGSYLPFLFFIRGEFHCTDGKR